VLLQVLTAAGACQRQLVGEVAVDGHSADSGALGDLADRRRGGPDRLVKLDRRIDDPLLGFVLEHSPTLQLVRTGHDNHDTCCFLKLDRRLKAE
jgi:hypothetical protein